MEKVAEVSVVVSERHCRNIHTIEQNSEWKEGRNIEFMRSLLLS